MTPGGRSPRWEADQRSGFFGYSPGQTKTGEAAACQPLHFKKVDIQEALKAVGDLYLLYARAKMHNGPAFSGGVLMRAKAPVKAFALRRHLTQKLRRCEARAVFFRQTIAQGDESGGALDFEHVCKTLAMCVLAEDGKSVFASAQEWEVFGGLHMAETVALFHKVQVLSGLDGEALKKS